MENQKKWYHNSLFVIVLLVLFFPVGLVLMWKFANWNKAFKWGITGIFGMFVALSIFGNNQTPQTDKYAEAVNTSAVQQSSSPIAQEFTMNDKLWQAFDNTKDSRYKKGFEIQYMPEEKKVMLISYPEKYWSETNMYDLNETRLVSHSINTFVAYGLKAFQIDGVEVVGVDYRMPFTDNYGKQTTETAFKFAMSKSEFGKYDWNNLNNKPVYSQIVHSANETDFEIKPSILRNLEKEKVKLAL